MPKKDLSNTFINTPTYEDVLQAIKYYQRHGYTCGVPDGILRSRTKAIGVWRNDVTLTWADAYEDYASDSRYTELFPNQRKYKDE